MTPLGTTDPCSSLQLQRTAAIWRHGSEADRLIWRQESLAWENGQVSSYDGTSRSIARRWDAVTSSIAGRIMARGEL